MGGHGGLRPPRAEGFISYFISCFIDFFLIHIDYVADISEN
jgi:hypothetical protein